MRSVNKHKTKQNEIVLAVQHKYVFSVCPHNIHLHVHIYLIMLEHFHTNELRILLLQRLLKMAEHNITQK